MRYFAQVINGIVEQVLVTPDEIGQDLIAYAENTPGNWIETWRDGQTRKNYAGIGYSYDQQRNAFIPPKPHDSWLLDEATCTWMAPTPKPDDGYLYIWREDHGVWERI